MDAKVLASQKHQERLAAFWPRKISRYITAVAVRTPITPNQVTVLWGLISALNCFTVYYALVGRRELIPLIPVIYVICIVLDSVDGEVARFKNMANPIGGKLLDGICHRATEFALLATYAAAGYVITGSFWAVVVALVMLTGDGMYTYVYERRINTLRGRIGYKGHIRFSADSVYDRGTRFADLSNKKKLGTFLGLINYKSVYAVIALSYLPPVYFLAGLAAIGAYKHWKWIKLAAKTLTLVTGLQAEAKPEAVGTTTETANQAAV